MRYPYGDFGSPQVRDSFRLFGRWEILPAHTPIHHNASFAASFHPHLSLECVRFL